MIVVLMIVVMMTGVVYSYNNATSLMSGLNKSRAPELFYIGTNHLLVFSMECISFHPSGV
jgi:hypothetical protein